MRAWVLKKMNEYLGEEEHTLTDFILSKLQRKCQPKELLTGENIELFYHFLFFTYLLIFESLFYI